MCKTNKKYDGILFMASLVHADKKEFENTIKKFKQFLKPNGTIWISGTYHSIYACGFALQKLGFKILNDITWYKPNASPNLSCKYFTASHETILWAIKDSNEKHTFNYQIMKNGSRHVKDIIKNNGKQMRSVWSISTTSKSEVAVSPTFVCFKSSSIFLLSFTIEAFGISIISSSFLGIFPLITLNIFFYYLLFVE